jgi:hypothetical protein
MSRQLELFGGGGKNGNAQRNEPLGVTEGASDGRTSPPPAANIGHDPRSRQDRDHTSSVGQGPARGQTVLAQALGKAPPPFDFAAAILADPRAVPQPDVPVPEWLRLPGVDP